MAGYCELRGMNDAEWTAFDVNVFITDYEESVNVLDGEAAGRAKQRGRMIRDPLGAFLGHKITFERDGSTAGLDTLWDWLWVHSVEDSVYIRAADGQTTIEYEAYYTSFSRKLETVINGVRYWRSVTVNFIPMDPQLVPV